jgi:deoxyribodipyrimidine photo-lyase
MTAIHWFRQDLRLADNPSLLNAIESGRLLPVFILDDTQASNNLRGGASLLWLHHALHSLNKQLDGHLQVYKGDPKSILLNLCQKHDINKVCWNRCYEGWRIKRDSDIKDALKQAGIEAQSFNGSLLWEPWTILKGDGTPYKVFTPFFKNGCLRAPEPSKPLAPPCNISFAEGDFAGIAIDALDLQPSIGWDKPMLEHWNISEQGALDRLERFANEGVVNYKDGRNLPAHEYTSRLAPYMHWGQISPRTVWHAANMMGDDDNVYTFKSELGWREFAYSLMYFNPDLQWDNMNPKFNAFPWGDDRELLKAWQHGNTGYPIVDAGMRELWQTGYMHNRVRMIVGSFLVKNLLIHWHHGERWFWDTLFDADYASNSTSWQWVAGCGADAAPYFRIFNPVTQGEKFDPDGDYTRRWVPELKDLPKKYLYQPWEAPPMILKAAGVELGENYPHPVVEIKASRERALEAFKSMSQ